MSVLDTILSIGGGPSYLNLLALFGARILLVVLALLGTALIFAFDNVLAKIFGVLVFIAVVVISITLVTVLFYASFILFQQGLNDFPTVLLFTLYVSGILSSFKQRFKFNKKK